METENRILISWSRSPDGDGICAEKEDFKAEVFKRSSISRASRQWFWNVYGPSGVLLKSGSSHRQQFAKASAESVMGAKIAKAKVTA